MDVLGFLFDHGFGLVNSFLVVVLFYLIRDRVSEMDKKVKTLWDWHLIQTGLHQARLRKREDDDE